MGYARPTDEALAAFGRIARARSRIEAAEAATSIGYAVNDIDVGWVARDGANDPRGWGVIAVRPEGRDIIVEIPHPMDEHRTVEIGRRLFRSAGARMLLLAGAGRDEADVSHEPDTPFDRAHRAALPAAAVVQIHGYGERDGYPDVVLSAGVHPAPGAFRDLERALTAKGLSVGTWEGGSRFRDLAATETIQGASTRDSGGAFIHIELSRELRDDDRLDTVVEALAEGLRPLG